MIVKCYHCQMELDSNYVKKRFIGPGICGQFIWELSCPRCDYRRAVSLNLAEHMAYSKGKPWTAKMVKCRICGDEHASVWEDDELFDEDNQECPSCGNMTCEPIEE